MINNKEQREITRVRLRLLDLFKSFFHGEPDAEKMSRWRGTFHALTKERVNSSFDAGAKDIESCLHRKNLEELQEEYYKLFTDPFTDKGLQTVASFYLSGRSHGKTLVDLRSLLIEAKLERAGDVVETEDSLVVMLDIYARLIEGEDDDEKALKLQSEVLHTYLIPFSSNISQAADDNEFADFYRACCRFLCGYLEMEGELVGAVQQN